MIALLLGSLLILGVTQIFISNSQTFRINEATARVQENARLASEILGRAIRGAGFVGCKPTNAIENQLAPFSGTPTARQQFMYGLRAGRGITSETQFRPASGTSNVAGTAQPDTDFFAVSRVSSSGSFVSAPTVNSASFNVDNRGDLVAGDIVLVGNCVNADIAQISSLTVVGGGPQAALSFTDASATPGNALAGNAPTGCTTTPCLGAVYAPAHVMRLENEGYFIGEAIDGSNGLFLTDGANTFELVSGIEDMQVRYAVGSPPTYVDTPTNWDDVNGVQLSLLVRGGAADLLDAPQALCYPSWSSSCPVTMPDNALYRVVEFVTTLRNPL